jgi:hypothetical protein
MPAEIKILELRGAYGRKTIIADWWAGYDFKIINGPYCSIQDTEELGKEYHILEFVGFNGRVVGRISLDPELDLLDGVVKTAL